jgi:hypothetical protein
MLAHTLEEILNKSGGERAAYQFLKEHPAIVLWSFVRVGGHSQYLLAEFPIGIRYRADFVILYEYSGGWEVYLIELEPVHDRVITKDGRPSKRLNSAISQLNDWAEYIETNRLQVKQDLSDWCIRHDLLGWDSPDDDHDDPPNIKYPESYAHFRYHVIIGRREPITKDKRRKMNQWRRTGGIAIGTYDRFLDVAKNMDYNEAHPNEPVWLSEIKE